MDSLAQPQTNFINFDPNTDHPDHESESDDSFGDMASFCSPLASIRGPIRDPKGEILPFFLYQPQKPKPIIHFDETKTQLIGIFKEVAQKYGVDLTYGKAHSFEVCPPSVWAPVEGPEGPIWLGFDWQKWVEHLEFLGDHQGEPETK